VASNLRKRTPLIELDAKPATYSRTKADGSRPSLRSSFRVGVRWTEPECNMRGAAIDEQQGGAKLEHGRIGLPGGLTPECLIETAARHGARNVRVFGSVARGTAAKDSDLDLLVDMEPGRDLFDLVALKREMEEALGLKVDVLTENSLSPYLRERVLREAVPL
jgi:uncharacterized protein